jgi:hypothetical protein
MRLLDTHRLGLAALAVCITFSILAMPLPFIGATLAWSACAPDLASGVDVTCTGTDTDGYDVPAGGIGNLVVEYGALVTDTTAGPIAPSFDFVIDGRSDAVASFTNNGTVEATFSRRAGVVLATITVGDFVNTGTIIGAFDFFGVSIGSLLNGGITNLGAIAGQGGLFVDSDTSSINNSGTITGGGSSGVEIDGSLETFSNTGLVSGAEGLVVQDDLTSLTNGGTLTGTVFEGVLVGGTIASLTNTGLIFGEDDAIEAHDITNLTNFGLISGDDDGIDVDGGGPDNNETSVISHLVNHGTIQGNDDGIDVGTLTSLVNTGTIAGGTTDGLNNAGIAAAAITSIVNSGTISAGSPNDLGYAIEERGPLAAANENTSLTLNAGSILIGYVDLGGGTNTLNIGQGRSLNSTFDGDIALSTLPVLGNTNGALVAFLDTPGIPDERQIVAVDQSAFLGLDDALVALTAGIGQTVQGRQTALRSDPALGFANSFAAAEETSLAAFSDLDLDGAPHLNPNRFWIEGFGAYRQDDGNRVAATSIIAPVAWWPVSMCRWMR